MAGTGLPGTGAISANDINVELGKVGTDKFDIDASDNRALAQVTTPGSQISLDNFHGRANYIESITWSSSTILDITQNITLTITGKKSTDVTYYLKFPDGTTTSNQTVTLDANGNYSTSGQLFYPPNFFKTTQSGSHTLYATFTGGSGTTKTQAVYITNISFIISTNKTNFDIRYYAASNGWDGTSLVNVIINSGVTLYSTSIYYGGLQIMGAFPNGITVVNNGTIMGQGGTGGRGGSANNTGGAPGERGGPGIMIGWYTQTALNPTSPNGYSGGTITIKNNGIIAGGGGGGGGGNGWHYDGGYGYGGGGGGGGAGGGYGGRGGDGDGAGGGANGAGGALGVKGGDGAWGGSGSGASGAGGGGGGRIIPGVGGVAVAAGVQNGIGTGGGSGGAGGFAEANSSKSGQREMGGSGGSGALSGLGGYSDRGLAGGGGGGGGWGAAGGNGAGASWGAGGVAGKAIVTGPYTATVVGGGTYYGATSGYWS